MNWFRELLTVIVRLFGAKSPKKQPATAQNKKPVRNIPVRNPSAADKGLKGKNENTAKAPPVSETKSESVIKPEKDEPVEPAFVAEKACAQTTENSFAAGQEEAVPEPDVVSTGSPESAATPQPAVAEAETNTTPDILVQSEPQPGLQPDIAPESLQEQPAAEQEYLSDEIALCAAAPLNWEAEEKDEFTLWQFRQETAEEDTLAHQMANLHIMRQEPLNLPPTDNESAWAQNAAQAGGLILMPFQARVGVTKTFVADGIVSTIWEEKQKGEGITKFVAVVLTHQRAYILTGQKDKQFSAEKLAECFALRPEHGNMRVSGMDKE